MQTVALVPHPKSPSKGMRGIEVDIGWAAGRLHLRYVVDHDGGLEIPESEGRQDGLWQTTCFEIFVRDGTGPRYVEFNFAPTDAWAGYGFVDEREGLNDLDVVAPAISAHSKSERFEMSISLHQAVLPADLGSVSLSAVIEEQDSIKSYWAICHPNADKPDFHDPRCFVLNLSPPPAA